MGCPSVPVQSRSVARTPQLRRIAEADGKIPTLRRLLARAGNQLLTDAFTLAKAAPRYGLRDAQPASRLKGRYVRRQRLRHHFHVDAGNRPIQRD